MANSLFPFILTPALSLQGQFMGAAKLAFYLTDTLTLATVYDADGDPISQAANGAGVVGVEADAYGRYPTIYLDDTVTYRVRQRTALGVQIGDDIDPYSPGLSGAAGAGKVGYNAENTYPDGTVGRHLQSFVSVTDAPFGAKCDGATDDTDAVNAAIAHCIDNRINYLHVPGVCKVTGPLIYDNPVDNSMGGVVIYGGTITTAVVGPLFKTTLGDNEASECLLLRDMTFIHTSPSAAGWLASSGLLRFWMRDCTGIGIKLNGDSAAGILQDWDIDSSNRFTAWEGQLVDALEAYNWRFSAKLESAPSGSGIKIGTVHGGILGGDGAIAESILGPVAEIGAFEALTIDRWYTENNTNLDFKLATTQASRGLIITGCRLAPSEANSSDSAFWDLDVGLSEDVVSIGNWCASQYCKDDSVAPGMLQSIGDKPVDPVTGTYMPTWLTKSGRFGFILPNGMDSQTFGITAHAGGGGTDAVPLITPMNVITVCASAGDSVKLPPAVAGIYAPWCFIYNGAALAAAAFPAGTDTIAQNGATVTSSSVASSRLAMFHCFVTGQWVRVDLASVVTLTDPTGGATIDTQARSAIVTLNALMRLLGLGA